MYNMQVGIKRWDAWAQGVRGAAQWQALLAGDVRLNPDSELDFLWLKPRQRRRLSMISKMTLDVAGACSAGDDSVATVFASRRGEVSRMVSILMDIETGEGASPTDFSLSVHNTSSGLLSINTQNQMPSTAIAAGCDTVAAGFTEAWSQVTCDQRDIMLVVFEDRLPSVYQAFASEEEQPVVMAFVLSETAEQYLNIAVESHRKPEGKAAQSTFLQLSAVVRALLEGGTVTFSGERHLCHLQRIDR